MKGLTYFFIYSKEKWLYDRTKPPFVRWLLLDRTGPVLRPLPVTVPKPSAASAPGAASTEKPLEGARSGIASHSSPVIFKQAHFICWQHILRVETM